MLAELTAILNADLPSQDDAAKLSETLYNRCYTRSILDSAGPSGSEAAADLPEALEAANCSRSKWVEGWRIDQVLDDGRVVARKNGAERAFLPGEYITHRGLGVGPKEGTGITVFVAAGSSEIQPAFYYAFGETVGGDEPAGILRFYWNIQPEGAPRLMKALTRELNRFQLPFHFKCLNSASYFPRRDAAVLYIDRRYYFVTALLVESVHSEVLRWLNGGTPLFTKPLAHGLALAEDPDDSFGQHRCGILAGAMIASLGKPSEERLAEVRRRFEERGLCRWIRRGSIRIRRTGTNTPLQHHESGISGNCGKDRRAPLPRCLEERRPLQLDRPLHGRRGHGLRIARA